MSDYEHLFAENGPSGPEKIKEDTMEEKIKKYPPGIQKRMQNLIQFSGGKKDKNKGEIVIEPDVFDIDSISIDLPKIEDINVDTIPATVAAVLNKTELKLYIKEVTEWRTSHPDWNLKEDIDDINNIAMEKVIQYRLLLAKKKRPSLDIEKDYNSSVYRMQAFRQNLSARRADRIKKKSGGNTTMNIAVMAATLDETKMKELQEKNRKEEQEEIEFFPEANS